jgi:predicted nucleic acid-binding protein
VTSPAFALDTSCVVAAVCSWHEQHAVVADEIERRLDLGERMIVAAHVLVESYAVLTRLPPPHRLSPNDAWTLIRENFVRDATLASLSAAEHVRFLDRAARTGIRGGRTYDALIAECVSRSEAPTLLTLNPRHFDPVAGKMIIVDAASTRTT